MPLLLHLQFPQSLLIPFFQSLLPQLLSASLAFCSVASWISSVRSHWSRHMHEPESVKDLIFYGAILTQWSRKACRWKLSPSVPEWAILRTLWDSASVAHTMTSLPTHLWFDCFSPFISHLLLLYSCSLGSFPQINYLYQSHFFFNLCSLGWKQTKIAAVLNFVRRLHRN